MILVNTKLKGLYKISHKILVDDRGSISHQFNKKKYESKKIKIDPEQILHHSTFKKQTLRGIHYSIPPFSESKLVIPITGVMFWVVVDLRKGSKTFGNWESFNLEANKTSFFAESGFGHGCLSLTDNVNLTIIASKPHSDKHSSGIIWNDKTLNIKWPLEDDHPLLISNNHSNNYKFHEFVRKVLDK
tara:strand:+ start:148 stop:708 length:561 start_codon:yes stop_codon:yes gene_type:complete